MQKYFCTGRKFVDYASIQAIISSRNWKGNYIEPADYLEQTLAFSSSAKYGEAVSKKNPRGREEEAKRNPRGSQEQTKRVPRGGQGAA